MFFVEVLISLIDRK